MSSPASLPYLTPSEQLTFCRTGTLPAHVLRSVQNDRLVTLLLFEVHCPCGENDPAWIRQTRDVVLKQKPRPYFPKLFVKYGVTRYTAAMKALEAYRPVKGFHKTWSGLRKAATAASLGLTRNENELTVDIAAGEWAAFVLLVSAEIRSTLEGQVQSAAQEGIESKLSERNAVRLTTVLTYLQAAQTLKTIWDGVKAKELANRKRDDPEVFERKLKFFIGIMATKGKTFNKGEFDKLYSQYRQYDKAYWPLLDYTSREKALQVGQSDSWGHQTVRSPSGTDTAASSKLPDADFGLKF